MEPLKPELISSLEGLQPQPTNIPLYSTVSGALVQGPELDAHYWCRNVRDTVHFTDAIAAMADAGFDTFVEIAPHPVLSDGIQETLESVKKKGFVVHTLRRKEDEVLTLTANLARLHSWGAEIDFSRLFLDGGAFVQLPRYPWQRERYWLESEQGRRQRLGLGAHPHLMRQSVSAREKSNILWEVSLDKRVHKYIDEHRVQGPVIFPGAGHVELALSAGLASFAEAFDFLENVNFESALFLPDEGEPPGIQLDISHDGGNYFIYTKPQGAESWTLCSNGRMSHIGERFESQAIDLAAVRGRVTRKVAVDEMHDVLDRGGLQLGPAFRCVKKLWYGENETYGELEVHESIRSGIDRFNLHPAVLDGCFQTMFGLFFERHERGERMGVYIPIHIDRVKLHRKPGSNKLYVYGKLRSWSDEHTLGDLWIFNEQDELVAEFQGFRTQYLKGSRGEQGNEAELWFYEFNWRMKTRADLAQARDSGQFLPGPAVLAETAREPIREIQGSARQREYYDEIEPDLYRACVGYILNAFSAMGLPVRAGSRIDPTAALKSASIQPKHARLFRHLFELLKGSGVASELGGVFELGETRSPAEPSALLAELSKKHPRFQHDLSLLSRCGPELKQVLQGKTDPIQLLFPEDQWDSIVQFYVEAFAFKKYYDLAKPVIAELVRRLPPEQNLRVLELGAGTGGMTQALLPLLPPERTEYVFTDLSQLFLLKAKQRFSRFPFVQYRTLDIEKPPSRAELGSFDLVIASDVLHATRDLKKTLTNVKELLASEGMLLMLEVTNTPIFLDLIFGMTEGWWLFEDKERRKTHATMPPQQWRTLLEESEFSDVQLLSDFAANERACQTLILARGPELARDGQLHLAAKANEGRCLVFADNRGVHERLEARLRGFGKTCIRVLPGERYRQLAPDRFELNPLDPEDMSKLVERTLGAETIESTLFLWALNNPDNTSLSVETLEKGEQSGSLPLLHYMRCLNRSGRKTFPATWIVTAGAQNVAGIPETVQLGQSAIRGVGRVIINEFSHIETTIVDLSESAEDDEIAALAEEMIAGDREEELAFRGRRRFVNRLERIGAYAAARSAQKSVGAAGYPFTTAITEAGLLDNLVLREAQRRQPGAREVEIQVKAAALNFRDVMIAMGLLSEDAIRGGHFGRNFGLECSGVVSRVGNDVRDFAPGDEVFGFAPASISGFAVAKDCLTLKKPRRLSWEEAASLPAVYLTAYYSLFHHCRLAAGEKILIHAAAGGVGTAAIHLARAVGAEIYATVGSEEKRRYVQSLGVKAEHTFDSRSLAFADEIMAATGGAGVDVVLNSLAGPAIHKSVRCLAPYGRFVEIGKTDIYRNSKLALEPFGNNLSYFAVDIDRMLEQKPEFASRMLREAMRFFEENAIPPHAVTTFPAARVADAFVTMAGARHTGKVAVSVADEILVSPPAEIAFKDAATYLVTGGASGFGLAVANWMTTKGARHLALLSRSGPKTDEERLQIQAMRARGVEVQLLEGDVTRREDVERVLEQIRRSMPPLAGIHHAAMVLDDGMIPELDAQRYFKAYRPKVLGAWNLHVATRDLPLDFFVQYSSVSAVFGVPGQANYAAANNFLDGLSQFRRSQGLASMTINWGALGDVGFVARAGHVEASLTKQGWNVFSLEQSTSVLETMMLQNPVQRAATDTNWEKVGEFFPARLNTSRFGHLMREKELGGQAGGSGDGALRAMLLSAEPSQRSGILSTSLRDALARVVGMGAEKIDPADPVTKLGLDSLMANQIRNWIHGNTGVDYSMMRIMRGPTLHELTSQVLDELIGTSASAQTASDSSADRWLLRPRLVEKPRLRIFCFPYFGGGASVYAPWATELPSDVEVCAVQFPGREERETERAHDRIEELVDELAQLLAPLLDRPYVFYAHSAGAAVSYELVRRLRRDRKPLPLHLVVGGSRAPHLPSAFSVIEGLPEAEVLKRENSERIVAYMRRLEIPEGVLQNRELMHRMLPSLRADILLGMRYS
ncbi:MAG TPA: SDR family NAD(P)-dependent oxidoreductase, partial [Polyangiaceae bacterium]|nr:SDR family NAD(P)-dependent oxidoreductase [Polyangiaceae bacterium]